MIRKITTFVIALVMIMTMYAFGTELVLKEKEVSYTEIEKYTVHLFSLGYRGLGSCSGVVLKNYKNYSEVLTCKHCISVNEEFLVEDKKVDKIITSVGDDLAYLIINDRLENKESARLAKRNSRKGERILMVGRPGLVVKYPQKGKVVFYNNSWGFAQLKSLGGCSGSGIFNYEGELVGILWGTYTEQMDDSFFSIDDGVSISIFEPLTDIKRFLKKIN